MYICMYVLMELCLQVMLYGSNMLKAYNKNYISNKYNTDVHMLLMTKVLGYWRHFLFQLRMSLE